MISPGCDRPIGPYVRTHKCTLIPVLIVSIQNVRIDLGDPPSSVLNPPSLPTQPFSLWRLEAKCFCQEHFVIQRWSSHTAPLPHSFPPFLPHTWSFAFQSKNVSLLHLCSSLSPSRLQVEKNFSTSKLSLRTRTHMVKMHSQLGFVIQKQHLGCTLVNLAQEQLFL